MNIKNVLKEKNFNNRQTLNILKDKKEILDVPKVIFKDSELQFTIGQWLGILSSQKNWVNSHFAIYKYLKAKKFREIEKKFGLLLKMTGIENTETCILSQFNKNNFSFNCHFNNSDNDANISLRWGDMIDFNSELIINYQNECKTYDYWTEYGENTTRLKLQDYTIKNPENENSCYRYLSTYKIYFTLTNGKYSFLIEIERPESIKADIFGDYDYVFRLENEDQLQQYLLGLTFPLEIDEVYKKICEISTNSVDKYPNFKIEIKRKIDKKKDKTTDMIYLEHGQLKKFIITKNGKTIEFDESVNLSYNSHNLYVNQDHKDATNNSLNSISGDELTSFELRQEIEQVKKLAKNMFKTK